jgi:hypothetical protein
MISSLKKRWWECGAYIDAVSERQASERRFPGRQYPRRLNVKNYNDFTNMNSLLNARRGFIQLLRDSFSST